MDAPHAEPSIFIHTRPRFVSPLSGTRLLASGFLSHDEQHGLEAAVSSVKSTGPNIDLVREGERANKLFIIKEGWGCRYATTREGGRQLTALLVPGDVGNLDSLMLDSLDDGVRTITPMKFVELPRNRALALAGQHPGIARTFTWLGAVENAILSKWTLSLGRRSAVERLAHLLCELSVRLHAEVGEKSRFAFPLTQHLLADVLGLTAVHVNRTMHRLRTEGLIMTDHRTMTLPDVTRLRHVGEFDPSYLHIAPPADARPTRC
jgi:CRP-like cAMP-binding protein